MPGATAATNCTSGPAAFANCLSSFIINPILALLFALGLLVFIWGVVQYMWGLSAKGKNSDEGKQHMLWGLVGMFIMAAAYTILRVINNSIGATNINL